VHEILRHLPKGARVLDLGSGSGSFEASRYPIVTLRADLDTPRTAVANFVQCDAAKLPFATGAFSAVISNHSLEHFSDLGSSLREIGRVIRPGGSLYVAVPDSSTITDRIYRWLGKGGGHVNPFTSSERLIAAIERATGLPHVATRSLCTSLSFLNRRNSGPWPRKKLLLGGGTEGSLRLLTYIFRLLDRRFGTHTSIYGWAFYFGTVQETIDSRAWTNVCVRCGAGHSAASLISNGCVMRSLVLLRCYDCPNCRARNLFTRD
jgi:SAM-dependent methyltransferase